jgi:hypothetical protein
VHGDGSGLQVSLGVFVLVGLGWQTSEYYVLTRQTGAYDVRPRT